MLSIEVKDKFTQAYITCALWSSTDDNGSPLDANYSAFDLSPDTVEAMAKDCAGFQRHNPVMFTEEYPGTIEQAGHDFWLTRNGHGAGFWDRGVWRVRRTTHQSE